MNKCLWWHVTIFFISYNKADKINTTDLKTDLVTVLKSTSKAQAAIAVITYAVP